MTLFSRVSNFAHALGCLLNWQPMIGNIDIIGSYSGTNDRTLEGIGNIGTIGSTGKTLNGTGMPVVPLVEPRTHARSISLTVPEVQHQTAILSIPQTAGRIQFTNLDK